MKAAIEEAEYAASKGVGATRLLSEGRVILVAKMIGEAVEAHHKGIAHIADVLVLLQREDEV